MHILSAFLFLSLCLSCYLFHPFALTHCKTFSDCRSYNNFLAQSLKIKHTHKSSFPLSLFLSHSISLYQMHFYLIPFCPLYIVGIVGTMRENWNEPSTASIGNKKMASLRVKKLRTFWNCDVTSVTRLGDFFLHSGQPFKAGGNNYFTQIARIVRQVL